MSITVPPGASFETVMENAPTGLVGTIGVRIVDNVGGTTVARVTAGIIETPAGSGRYAATLTAPLALGQYGVLWDIDAGGVASPTNSASDDLVVEVPTAATIITPVPAIVPSAGASAAPGVFYIKRGDTREPIIYQALEGTQPINVTGATIRFLARVAPDDGAGLVIDKTAHILAGTDPANGWLIYQWNDAMPHTDTDVAGDLFAEFEITFPDGRIHTVPTTTDLNHEYIVIRIVKDLD